MKKNFVLITRRLIERLFLKAVKLTIEFRVWMGSIRVETSHLIYRIVVITVPNTTLLHRLLRDYRRIRIRIIRHSHASSCIESTRKNLRIQILEVRAHLCVHTRGRYNEPACPKSNSEDVTGHCCVYSHATARAGTRARKMWVASGQTGRDRIKGSPNGRP